ncbi:MFS transporter [Halobiforma lacisalsi AJ5]|uniref:MFS transporter n=1 Tax=Natronobacterium lacisalsi AJ5 TaxID=358396 RepID=M0LG70_NATLA|nr:MFS transporter [Halobiforma lacisalsi]APW96645.1 MFS transporter [Halobiforma lacisalsi AJ5]EMA32073.1 hypothetical protein C445_12201 [Halobiforma lacisalsi AJ5]
MERVRSRLPTVLGELRSNRSFLRLLAGRLVTNAGDSLYYIAAMWLVFELTGSPLYTGLAGFFVRAPSALSVLTGPLVDRWSLRRVLVGTQLINGLLVLAVPVAAWTGRLSVWVVLALLPVVTFVNQFVYPAQNAALPRIVDDDDLAKANSLLSAAYQGADMVFNAASGVLIALVGAVTLFVVDSITFGVALLLFAGVSVASVPDPAENDAEDVDTNPDPDPDTDPDREPDAPGPIANYRSELAAGIGYVRGSLLIVLLIGVVVANFTAGAMLGVLPAFADTVGGPDAFGILMAAYAGGSFAGTVLASRLEDLPLGRFAAAGNVLSGTLLAAALVLSWFPLTVGLFFLTFVPVGAFNVLFWTMLQSAVDDDLLGRVSSLVTSAATVAIPVGSAVGGAVAGVVGSRFVMFGWAVGNLFFGLYVTARPALRTLPPASEISAAMLRLGDETGPAVDKDPDSDAPPTDAVGASDP